LVILFNVNKFVFNSRSTIQKKLEVCGKALEGYRTNLEIKKKKNIRRKNETIISVKEDRQERIQYTLSIQKNISKQVIEQLFSSRVINVNI